MTDLRRDYFVTRLIRASTGDDVPRLDALLDESDGARLARSSPPRASPPSKVHFLRYGKFRYENQEHSVEVAARRRQITDAAIDRIAATFHETYEREYTYRLDAPVEIVGVHLVASAEVGKLTMPKREATGARSKPP